MLDEIILLEERDNVINCISKVSLQDLMFAMSKYRYFYNKTIIWKDKVFEHKGIDIDNEWKKEKEYEIKLYSRLIIKPMKIKKKQKVKEPIMNSTDFLKYFEKLYEENYGIILNYSTAKKQTYLNKIKNMMDAFYKNGFNQNTIKKYMRRSILFGNHNGDAIYLEWVYNENIINNYLLILKGKKSVSELWKHLDVSLSAVEKRKIKYYMNLNNWDTFSDVEKKITMKLYKIYDKRIFNQLKEKYEYTNNFYAKIKIFEILSNEEKLNMPELLIKTKHTDKYFQYEYIKEQIIEVFGKGRKNENK